MSAKENLTNPIQPTTPTLEAKQTEGPLLLEIKAAVEKLAGDVRGLTERMNKEDAEKQKKPEDKYPPPCKEDIAAANKKPKEEEEKAGKKPYPEKEKAEKPEDEKKPKEEEKAKKPEPYPGQKKQDEHGCSTEEEWDEGQGKCVPKTSKQDKKPEEYPYPSKEKKSTDLITEQFEDLKNEVTSLRKCLGMPAFKRTQVIKKEDIDAPIDVSAMSWAQVHELDRPIDLRRGA
jgi:hypothetical protein